MTSPQINFSSFRPVSPKIMNLIVSKQVIGYMLSRTQFRIVAGVLFKGVETNKT